MLASSSLPADYRQLELPFDVQRTRTELVWKSDIWFGEKALGLKATIGDVIHYCQLPIYESAVGVKDKLVPRRSGAPR